MAQTSEQVGVESAMSALTEGVICGGLGGDAVSGGSGCTGTDDELGGSELAGLLGGKIKSKHLSCEMRKLTNK